MSIPTRTEVIELAEQMIKGEKSPIEVARWAELFDYPENESLNQELAQKDPALRDFIGTLSLAGAVNEHGTLLYISADFQDWLDEFKAAIGRDR